MARNRIGAVLAVTAVTAMVWGATGASAASPWKGEVSGTEVHLHGIFAFDGCHAWAVGEETGESVGQAVIVATTDGGAHWNPQSFPSGAADATTMNRVLFTDALNGYAAGENNDANSGKPNFLRTSDGGATWVDLRAGLPTATGSGTESNDIEGMTGHGNEVWITVAQYGGSGTPFGAILHSTDRGTTWGVQMTYNHDSFDSISMTSDNKFGWATSNDSLLWRTTDGGGQWKIVATTASEGEQVFAVSHGNAVIAEDSGHIQYTTDGVTLLNATVPAAVKTFDMTDVAIGSGGQGFATGELGGRVLATLDGGVTWTLQNSGAAGDPPTFNGVTATQSNSAWITGENGEIRSNKLPSANCAP